MTIEEIKELLPFFAAGTLDPDKKTVVEVALETSEELRKELQFWQDAQAAVASEVLYKSAGHLSAEQIVDYAEGTLVEAERAAVETHLQSCSGCTDEYRLVKESLAIERRVTPPLVDRFGGFIKSIRLAYALPALAAAALALIMIVNRQSHQLDVPQQLAPPEQHQAPPALPSTGLMKAQGKILSFALSYQAAVRGATEAKLPRVELAAETHRVNVTLVVPRTFKGGSYRVTISSPQGKSVNLGVFTPFAKGSSQDSLLVQLEGWSHENEGIYGFIVQELLPPSAEKKGFTAEPPYILHFILTHSK